MATESLDFVDVLAAATALSGSECDFSDFGVIAAELLLVTMEPPAEVESENVPPEAFFRAPTPNIGRPAPRIGRPRRTGAERPLVT
jgi:hypothetical protein